ncbi:Apoptotic ATPase [Handroanthus impetiginosus]|uniref:Apoptotic ATPase n=1 Tax=Handroanthus impetiginosus TaxID=429701 RepID=A0A2G9FYT9_9LAMI|nr:Apoptotic ATPase [Handroanthus impetiginosus]
MVDAVVESVIAQVANALLDEGKNFLQTNKNIKVVQETMSKLQSYLNIVESNKIDSLEANIFIKEIRELAQNAEDSLSEYLLDIEPDSAEGLLDRLRQHCRMIRHFRTVRKFNKNARKFDNVFQGIKQKADNLFTSTGDLKLKSDAAAAGSSSSVHEEVRSERKTFLHRDYGTVVGHADTFKHLGKEMSKGKKNKCRIITIVGPGGIGKTTIAKKIIQDYEKKYQRKQFVKALVHVPRDPDADNILRNISKQVCNSNDTMEKNWVDDLHSKLKDKRYVILLDDVWNIRTWDLLRDALTIASTEGGTIIVTSRDIDVYRHIDATAHQYKNVEICPVSLGVLEEYDARKLFTDMICSDCDYDTVISDPLKKIGEDILKRCGGLPLAIELVAGMLRVKPRTTLAWNEVLENMSRISENDCLKILAWSYKELPGELKPLFLYFGIFPRNHEIFVSRLIPLWIAEKFIPDDGKRDDYVEQQINKLVSRNLVHVRSRRFDGRVKSCEIHSLVHDLCTQLGEENNYFCTSDNLNNSSTALSVNTSTFGPKDRRRVTTNTRSILDKKLSPFDPGVKIPNLRALFCFFKDDHLFQFLKLNASKFKLLRLLIIEFDRDVKTVVEVPKEIANLNGLIYLKLVGYLSKIPESVGRLKRLQTLEIRSKDIPRGILKMKHVKHLFLSSLIVVKDDQNSSQNLPGCFKCSRDVGVDEDQDEELEVSLPNIRSLDVDFGPNFTLTPSSVKKLTNLRRLRIYVTKCEMLTVVFPANVEPVLPHLEALKLHIYVSYFSENEYQIPTVDLYRYVHLEKLNLYFDSPCDITNKVIFPNDIVKITLKRVINIEDIMARLSTLSKLKIIKLNKCKADVALDFSANFSSLEMLMLKQTAFPELNMDGNRISKLARFKHEPSPLTVDHRIPSLLRNKMREDTSREEEGLLTKDSVKISGIHKGRLLSFFEQ